MLTGPGEHLFLFRACGQYHKGGIRRLRPETRNLCKNDEETRK
jgi:hypothetical protein